MITEYGRLTHTSMLVVVAVGAGAVLAGWTAEGAGCMQSVQSLGVVYKIKRTEDESSCHCVHPLYVHELHAQLPEPLVTYHQHRLA